MDITGILYLASAPKLYDVNPTANPKISIKANKLSKKGDFLNVLIGLNLVLNKM